MRACARWPKGSSSPTSRRSGRCRSLAVQFDVRVVPGTALVLRAVETYDRAQTQRYKVYADVLTQG